jgi:hypothetical protein
MKHDRDLSLNRSNDTNDCKEKIKIIEELFSFKI